MYVLYVVVCIFIHTVHTYIGIHTYIHILGFSGSVWQRGRTNGRKEENVPISAAVSNHSFRKGNEKQFSIRRYVCMYVCMYWKLVCTVLILGFVCMYVCMYVCIGNWYMYCINPWLCVCMCVYVHNRIHSVSHSKRSGAGVVLAESCGSLPPNSLVGLVRNFGLYIGCRLL